MTPDIRPQFSESTANVLPAYARAQAALEAVARKGFNPHLGNKFATLGGVIDEADRVLHAEGLLRIQTLIEASGGVRLQTIFAHVDSGEWIADLGPFYPAVKSDPQAYGSAITYSRRYGLLALLGMEQEDDDGAAASKPKATPKTQLASIDERNKLEADIKRLPEGYQRQIGERVRKESIVWTQLSKAQHKKVLAWFVECKELADAE